MLTVTLEKKHNRKNFTCGEGSLDYYLTDLAGQDTKRDLAVCYVLPDDKDNVIGYYTLSSNTVNFNDLPEEDARKLRNTYDELPTVLIGRLARDNQLKGKNYGELLLLDALARSAELSQQIGVCAVIVDAINTNAEAFYSRYGFKPLPSGKRMMLPMKTIKRLLEE